MPYILDIWIFVVGACVGSFMNVVVWRLPEGQSLTHPGSHCPKCRHAIRLWDNIPILSWLILRGRCRDCSEPFSIRYMLVELLVACLFLFVAWMTVLDRFRIPVEWNIIQLTPELYPPLVTAYLLEMFLFCSLICMALIEHDGKKVPRRILAPAFVCGGATMLAGAMIPNGSAYRLAPTLLTGEASHFIIVDSLVAMFLAWLVGHFVLFGIRWLRAVFAHREPPSPNLPECVIVAACASGLMQGFIRAVIAIGFATVIHLICGALGIRRIPWTAWLLLAAVATFVILY